MQYINYIKGRLDGTGGRPACIKRQCGERAERAQLLLITALALAVILVTVALLLNAAIFTENVASRDTTADGHEAIELRGELVDGIGELIEIENHEGSGDPAKIESGIETMGPLVDRERARGGTVAAVSYEAHETGTLLTWESDPSFETLDNETIVSGLTDARAFELELSSHDSLSDPDASEIKESAFGVEFTTSGDNVTQYIYVDSGTIVVAEAIENGDPTPQCTVSQSGTTTVDLTGDRLSSDDSQTECYRGLWPDEDPESITLLNGEQTEGKMTLTVDNGASPSASLENDDAVYSTTVKIGYQTTDLTFETTAKIAPGEP